MVRPPDRRDDVIINSITVLNLMLAISLWNNLPPNHDCIIIYCDNKVYIYYSVMGWSYLFFARQMLNIHNIITNIYKKSIGLQIINGCNVMWE